jgi:hypothetical protein
MRNGWLVGLMAAGLALMPAAVHGQGGDIGVADPVFPIPLGHDRMEHGGFYVAGEFLFWRQTNPLNNQPIAFRGLQDNDGSITGVPGTFLGSHHTALSANDAAGPSSYEPGYRATVGWLFENGVAVEAVWTHLFEAKYAAVASILPPGGNSGAFLADSFLFSPVFNFPADFGGPLQKVALGFPGATFGIWNASSVQEIVFIQRYDEYGGSARFPLFQDECTRSYWLIGPRIVWLWERFKWRAVAFDVNTGQAGQDDVALYTNLLSQRLWGFHLGCGCDRNLGDTPIGTFAVAAEVEMAFYADFANEQSKYERGDLAIGSFRKRKEYTIVPEVQARVNLTWYPMEAVQFRVGYDFLAYFNTIASPSPVSFNYGGLDPPWEKGHTRILQGLTAGIGFVF